MYLHGGRVVPQLRSSDMSPQSLSPSQIQPPGIQRPVLAHWNWPGRHAAQSQRYVTHVPCNGASYIIALLQSVSISIRLSVCPSLSGIVSNRHFIIIVKILSQAIDIHYSLLGTKPRTMSLLGYEQYATFNQRSKVVKTSQQLLAAAWWTLKGSYMLSSFSSFGAFKLGRGGVECGPANHWFNHVCLFHQGRVLTDSLQSGDRDEQKFERGFDLNTSCVGFDMVYSAKFSCLTARLTRVEFLIGIFASLTDTFLTRNNKFVKSI